MNINFIFIVNFLTTAILLSNLILYFNLRKTASDFKKEIFFGTLCGIAAALYGARVAILLLFLLPNATTFQTLIIDSIFTSNFLQYSIQIPVINAGLAFGFVFFVLFFIRRIKSSLPPANSQYRTVCVKVGVIFAFSGAALLQIEFGYTSENMLNFARDPQTSSETLTRIYNSINTDVRPNRWTSEISQLLSCHSNTPHQIRIDLAHGLAVRAVCSRYKEEVTQGIPSPIIIEKVRQEYHKFDNQNLGTIADEDFSKLTKLIWRVDLPAELLDDAFHRTPLSQDGHCNKRMDEMFSTLATNPSIPPEIPEAIYRILEPLNIPSCSHPLSVLAGSKKLPVSVMKAMISRTRELHDLEIKGPADPDRRRALEKYRQTILPYLERNTSVPPEIQAQLLEVKALSNDYPAPVLSESEKKACEDIKRRTAALTPESSPQDRLMMPYQLKQCLNKGWNPD